VLRTRSPRAHPLYCYRELRVRLACVKHAASVRSEPGSNSRLKPDVTTVAARSRYDRNELLNRSVFLLLRTSRSGTSQWPPASVHPKQETKTKRVLACIIRLSKSRYSQASWKDYRRTPTLHIRACGVNPSIGLSFVENSWLKRSSLLDIP
jgi:hypothetical protein